MPEKNIQIPAKYIVPLNMNGLKGRMLRMPPPKKTKREALIVYGHHSSLERFYSLAQNVNDDIGVTMPDLPGFGGMDSFYTIDEKPDLDTMADYLASVIKLRYKKDQRFTIMAVSYGFVAITRMLERYPDIAKRVDLLMSIVGFTNKNEFKFSKVRYFLYLHGSNFFSHRVRAKLFRGLFLSPTFLRTFYARTHNAKNKFIDMSDEEKLYLTEFEVHLWRINDVRTHWATTVSFLKVNNTATKINLPVWNVYVATDNYFHSEKVAINMRAIFDSYHPIKAPVKNHMPNVISGKKETSVMIPHKIHKLLRQKIAV
jgi:pimeloyl-ACP methyl ester carboxylesterase